MQTAPKISDTHEFWYDLLDHLSEGVFVHRESQILFANRRLCDLIGLRGPWSATAAGSIDELFVDSDLDPVQMSMIEAWDGGEAEVIDARLVRKEGTAVWVELRSTRIDWTDGPAICSTVIDARRRRRAELGQARSEQFFRRIFHGSPQIITLTRVTDGRYIDVNNNFLELLGYQRDQVIGKTSLQLETWAELDSRNELIDRIRRGGRLKNFEMTAMTRSGDEIPCAVSADIISFDNEELLLLIARDIRDERQREAELRASRDAAHLANRSKSAFLANVSHELRTPLNAVLGFAEIIRDETLGKIGDERYSEYAADIHASGSHLLDIINDILDLSKIEAGRLEVHPQEVSLEEVARQCLRLVEPRAAENDLTLETCLPAEDCRLIADHRLLKQILINLLSNAIKFTPNGGRVTLRGENRADGCCIISVEDTGIGISPADLKEAMTPFGQVDSRLSRNYEGTGLGLPLVAAFTEKQGANLDIESAVGEGTTVTVTFPAEKIVRSDEFRNKPRIN